MSVILKPIPTEAVKPVTYEFGLAPIGPFGMDPGIWQSVWEAQERARRAGQRVPSQEEFFRGTAIIERPGAPPQAVEEKKPPVTIELPSIKPPGIASGQQTYSPSREEAAAAMSAVQAPVSYRYVDEAGKTVDVERAVEPRFIFSDPVGMRAQASAKTVQESPAGIPIGLFGAGFSAATKGRAARKEIEAGADPIGTTKAAMADIIKTDIPFVSGAYQTVKYTTKGEYGTALDYAPFIGTGRRISQAIQEGDIGLAALRGTTAATEVILLGVGMRGVKPKVTSAGYGIYGRTGDIGFVSAEIITRTKGLVRSRKYASIVESKFLIPKTEALPSAGVSKVATSEILGLKAPTGIDYVLGRGTSAAMRISKPQLTIQPSVGITVLKLATRDTESTYGIVGGARYAVKRPPARAPLGTDILKAPKAYDAIWEKPKAFRPEKPESSFVGGTLDIMGTRTRNIFSMGKFRVFKRGRQPIDTSSAIVLLPARERAPGAIGGAGRLVKEGKAPAGLAKDFLGDTVKGIEASVARPTRIPVITPKYSLRGRTTGLSATQDILGMKKQTRQARKRTTAAALDSVLDMDIISATRTRQAQRTGRRFDLGTGSIFGTDMGQLTRQATRQATRQSQRQLMRQATRQAQRTAPGSFASYIGFGGALLPPGRIPFPGLARRAKVAARKKRAKRRRTYAPSVLGVELGGYGFSIGKAPKGLLTGAETRLMVRRRAKRRKRRR